MVEKYLFDGYEAYRIRSGFVELCVLSLGATCLSLKFNDKELVLGYDSASYYENNDHKLGAVIGRVANRIAKAEIDVDGKIYKLPVNEQDYCIHGGPLSFDSKLYESEIAGDADSAEGGKVVFKRTSPDGENGFPGNLMFSVIYEVKNNEVTISFEGISDKDTFLAPTLHNYFGPVDDSRKILIQLNASKVLKMAPVTNIPNGELADVHSESDGKYDFTELKAVGADLDDCFVLDDTHAGSIVFPDKRAVIDIYTDMPAIQVYSGQGLKPPHHFREGLAVEPEFCPDSMHHSNFVSPLLKKGEHFSKYIKYIIH